MRKLAQASLFAAMMVAAAAVGTLWLSWYGNKLMTESISETHGTLSEIYETFTDDRDGNTYRVITIGGKRWTAENLNYQTDSSWCYNDDISNCEKYGRLYNWHKAIIVCPSGWHLPTETEWDELVETAGGKKMAAKKLKARKGWHGMRNNGTDDFGFSALPGGQRNISCYFTDIGEFGGWWVWAERDGYGHHGRFRSIHNDNNEVLETLFFKEDGFSVRCVADSP